MFYKFIKKITVFPHLNSLKAIFHTDNLLTQEFKLLRLQLYVVGHTANSRNITENSIIATRSYLRFIIFL